MKAILVLDEMPENCLNCQLANDEHAPYPPYYCVYCTALEKRIGESWHDLNGDDLRLDDCPLKEMPERKPYDPVEEGKMAKKEHVPIDWFQAYCTGWNACIDAIEGTGD